VLSDLGQTGDRRLSVVPGLTATPAAWQPRARRVLPEALLELVTRLERRFEDRRQALLEVRQARQAEWNAGATPGYVEHPEASAVAGDWEVAPVPADLARRRVEITGPVSDSKMVLNMLTRNYAGHRADCAMLDFEDSMKPEWHHVLAGLENLRGVVDGTLCFERPATPERPAKTYRLDPADLPVVMVRCRGLHLDEVNIEVDGMPVSAGLFDLAATAFHTSAAWLERGKTPKFYVPKVEHYLEARWWNELFAALEDELALPRGSLRATFLIETLPAAFQVEEILYELRERATGLNVGRWDKIFSDIKVLKEHPDRVVADRAAVTMQRPWMESYARNLIRTCHRHGAYAMGGMAAFTPGGSAAERQAQIDKVVSDKRWEAALGHDGCWVSHPFFIEAALGAFTRSEQLDVVPQLAARPDLLPEGGPPRTLEGLRTNVRVGIAYMEGWARGLGCVAWDNLMEDLATLEISRAQVWQWLRHQVTLDDGQVVSRQLVAAVFGEETERILAGLGPAGAARGRGFQGATAAAEELFCEASFRPFLTSRSFPAGSSPPVDH
jgi:malate synthase